FEFSDVKRSNPKIKYIYSAAAQGIMSGLGDGSFGVMKKISYNEAVTTLVRLTGYEPYARAKGGYPGGYLIAAQEAGITKGVRVNNSNEITNLDFVRLAYNALLAPCFEISSVSGEEAQFTPNAKVTLLSRHHNIYKDTGRVTANRFTDIYGESEGTQKGRIEVDKESYSVSENAGYEKFLGMKVEFFVRDDKSSVREIVVMNKTQDVESVLIAAKDIGNVTENTISYTENNKRASANLKTGFSFIYNARSYKDRIPADLKIPDGELLLVDGDGDKVYEIVVARCPEILVYEASNPYADMIYTSIGEFEVDMDYCSVVNVDDVNNPVPVTLSEIEAFSLLTVYRSKDNKCLEIYVTTNTKTGKITEKNENDGKIGVDGKIFETAPSLDISSLTFTTEYIFRIDAFGRIAYIDDENDGEKYGYLIGYGKGKGINPVREMRIVIAAEEYKDYNIAEKLVLDGANIKASLLDTSSAIFENGEVKPKLICFKLNKNSEIREIKTIHTEASVNGKYVTSTGIVTIGGKYAITSDTFFLHVPHTDYPDELKDYKLYRKPALKEEYGYTVTVYNVDDDQNCGAVIYSPKEPQSGNDEFTMSSKSGIVQSVKGGLDLDGNEVRILELMSGGKLDKYYINEEDVPSDFDLKFGDVIRFTMNSANTHITNLAREFRVAADNKDDYIITPHTSSEYYIFRYGLVDRKTKSYLIMNDENHNNESFIIPFSTLNSY
ncbi:MAG: S-layer homology domain-containing protein, partial [Clostridia bacterium]|nr:S-layer homology domain-containing protein [Clostridia bacterium]